MPVRIERHETFGLFRIALSGVGGQNRVGKHGSGTNVPIWVRLDGS